MDIVITKEHYSWNQNGVIYTRAGKKLGSFFDESFPITIDTEKVSKVVDNDFLQYGYNSVRQITVVFKDGGWVLLWQKVALEFLRQWKGEIIDGTKPLPVIDGLDWASK